MEFARIELKRSVFHYRENNGIIYGFSETDCEIEDIAAHFNVPRTVQLEQVHGNTIIPTSKVKGYPDGDGLILDEKNVMAVIRTADCIPLFFYSPDEKTGGVIHVGWRGLHAGIGVKLLDILRKNGVNPAELKFFMGPSIEGKCYTVQQDLVDKFKKAGFSKIIFERTPSGYSMDVARGIECCLIENGVSPENIEYSRICTFCSPNLPSYRRGDREKRIFNFILMR